MYFRSRILVALLVAAAEPALAATPCARLVGTPAPLVQIKQGRLLPVCPDPTTQAVIYLDERQERQALLDQQPILLYAGLTQPTGRYPVYADKSAPKVSTNRVAIAWVEVVEPDWPEQKLTLNLPKYDEYDAAELHRITRENDQIRSLFTRRTPRALPLQLIHPLAQGGSGGRFGSRRVINGTPHKRHTGSDYGVAASTPVRSIESGRVVLADEHYFAGNSVFIDHGSGLLSMYFHLQSIAVQVGQQVERGNILGTVGSSGRATGPHLHFGIRYRGQIVDPDELIQLFAKPVRVQ